MPLRLTEGRLRNRPVIRFGMVEVGDRPDREAGLVWGSSRGLCRGSPLVRVVDVWSGYEPAGSYVSADAGGAFGQLGSWVVPVSLTSVPPTTIRGPSTPPANLLDRDGIQV